MCLFDDDSLHSPVITFLYEGKHQLLTPSSGPVHTGFLLLRAAIIIYDANLHLYTALYSQSLLLKALDTTELIDVKKLLQ